MNAIREAERRPGSTGIGVAGEIPGRAQKTARLRGGERKSENEMGWNVFVQLEHTLLPEGKRAYVE